MGAHKRLTGSARPSALDSRDEVGPARGEGLLGRDDLAEVRLSPFFYFYFFSNLFFYFSSKYFDSKLTSSFQLNFVLDATTKVSSMKSNIFYIKYAFK